MQGKLLTHKLNLVIGSDELQKAGDYYLVDSLGSNKENTKCHPAIILKCPFCSRDMASIYLHKITEGNSFWQKLWRKDKTITVEPMLQCPWYTSHKFLIKNGKIKSLSNGKT